MFNDVFVVGIFLAGGSCFSILLRVAGRSFITVLASLERGGRESSLYCRIGSGSMRHVLRYETHGQLEVSCSVPIATYRF